MDKFLLADSIGVALIGTHDVTAFSGIGTGTPWKDASIMLMNCARFYGSTSSSVASFNGSKNPLYLYKH